MALRIYLEPDRSKRRVFSHKQNTSRLRSLASSQLLSLNEFLGIIVSAFERNVKFKLDVTADNVSGCYSRNTSVLRLLSLIYGRGSFPLQRAEENLSLQGEKQSEKRQFMHANEMQIVIRKKRCHATTPPPPPLHWQARLIRHIFSSSDGLF